MKDMTPLRMGFVGVGIRGFRHLNFCLKMDSIEVPAVCDTDAEHLYRAKRAVEAAGKPSPEIYGRGPTDFLRLCERKDLDFIVTATPWNFHAPVCLAAMKAGKHAATEVPAALTVDECWQLVETSEKTGKYCIMLEQENYNRESMMVLQMIRQGLFGSLVHAAGGYVHDLRGVKFSPNGEPWRLQHSIDRNGNLYPTHPTGPISWWLDINRGDRFEYLASMSTRSGVLNEFAAHYYGERSPYAKLPMAQGDVNTTILHTAKGLGVDLYFDTNTPHPHTAEFRVDGTRGLYAGNPHKVYLEGRSPRPDQWELIDRYRDEFDHPIWKQLNPEKFVSQQGHSELPSIMMWLRLLNALQHGGEPDMNVYDAATWSVISPLSERSVAAKSQAVDVPDFTRGKWQKTPPVRLA